MLEDDIKDTKDDVKVTMTFMFEIKDSISTVDKLH